MGFIDINGDGLLDYVRPTAGTIDQHEVYYNSGDGFSTTPQPLNLGRGVGTTHSCIRETMNEGTVYAGATFLLTDLRDFNGDGIPDRVQQIPDSQADDLRVFWGDGRGDFDQINGLSVEMPPLLEALITPERDG